MRRLQALLVLVSLFAALSVSRSVTAAEKRATPPTKAELVGTWVGLSQGASYFYRCQLAEDGKGVLVSVYLKEKAHVWNIDQWTQEGWRIRIKLTPASQRASSVSAIAGEVVLGALDQIKLTVTGDNWKQVATLTSEKELDERARLAKEASEATAHVEK
jgi:hypothetical protein